MVGDREGSTANRMTQRIASVRTNTNRATTASLSLPVFDVGEHARIGATEPGALVSDQRARARQLLETILQRARGDACARREVAMKLWLRVAEAAEYTGLSRDTIYTACERGELRHAHVGGRRKILLRPQWIDAWLERHAPDVQGGRTGGGTEVAS